LELILARSKSSEMASVLLAVRPEGVGPW
jgi:hypothetical protein